LIEKELLIFRIISVKETLKQPAMVLVNQLIDQFKKNLLLLVIAVVGVFLLLVGLFLTSKWMHFDLEKLTRDPAIITDSHPFIGAISNLGILLWTSSAVVCLLAAALHRKKTDRKPFVFYLFSGMFSSILMFDDLFMLHDWLLPVYFSIHETIVYGAYLLLMGAYLIVFFKRILELDFVILGFAGLFLGMSMSADVFLPQTGLIYFYEDSLKFVGILLWFLFFAKASYASISGLDKGGQV
jgi:hypothetical protein